MLFFFNDTATTEIYPLSLHDALPISAAHAPPQPAPGQQAAGVPAGDAITARPAQAAEPAGAARPSSPDDASNHGRSERSEEHTSELQSRQYLVCRLLLEKKKQHQQST